MWYNVYNEGIRKMIEFTIVDDEQRQIEELENFILQYCKKHDKAAHIRKYTNGYDLLKEKTFGDIIFLDIEMPSIDGMNLAQYIRKKDSNCIIVFITQMAQYALKGYEVEARDFIVKPVKYAALEFKLEKLINLVQREKASQIIINVAYEKVRLDVRDIYYIEVIKHTLIYHTTSGNYEVWGSMKNAVKDLEGYGFSLCNACYLVNLRYVERIADECAYVHGEPLKISRVKKSIFIGDLTAYGR